MKLPGFSKVNRQEVPLCGRIWTPESWLMAVFCLFFLIFICVLIWLLVAACRVFLLWHTNS